MQLPFLDSILGQQWSRTVPGITVHFPRVRQRFVESLEVFPATVKSPQDLDSRDLDDAILLPVTGISRGKHRTSNAQHPTSNESDHLKPFRRVWRTGHVKLTPCGRLQHFRQEIGVRRWETLNKSKRSERSNKDVSQSLFPLFPSVEMQCLALCSLRSNPRSSAFICG